MTFELRIPSGAHYRALGQSGLQQPAAGADGKQLALLEPAAGRPMAITATTRPGWGADTSNAAPHRIEAVFDRAKDFDAGFDHLSGFFGHDEYRVPLNTGPISADR